MSGAIRAKALLLAAGLFGGLAAVAGWTAMEVSSRPAFCGSCHIMEPYYRSWKDSRHGNVACVECHIAPGITAELKKKYQALSMVVSYFTGTYGTNPWAEIDDAACLRCHERRFLAGQELFGDVLFDHAAHLAGMRRGKRLRCTSCHSQIVQGSHIAVTASTCILCHFKGRLADTGTARCKLCHAVPDEVLRGESFAVDHANVERFGMECTWCHARPAGADGAVPRERCLQCHDKQSRLERFDDADLLHRTHVTEHAVDCMHCHLEIVHVGAPHLETVAAACNTCHAEGHSSQMSLYSGVGGRGVAPMPDAMFLGGVRCEGCHRDVPGQVTQTRRATEVSCMSCHGPSYRRVFLALKEDIAERTNGLEQQLSRTASELGDSAHEGVADARFNLDFVVEGRGLHNVLYATALLRKAHEDMNRARSERGLSELPLPWAQIPDAASCLRCHEGIEGDDGRIFGRLFRHDVHLAGAGLECSSCHRPHEERSRDEVVRFDAAGCDSCHHAEATVDCRSCHDDLYRSTVTSFLGAFDHAFVLHRDGLSCAACHDVSPGRPARLKTRICAGCHR